MSVNFNIITGKGSTRTYEITNNNIFPLSTYTGVPVTLSVPLSNIPSNYRTDYLAFSINDNFLIKGNNQKYNFPLPGVYKITLYNIDSEGEAVASYTTYLSAFNYLTDVLVPQIPPTTNSYTNDIYNNSSTSPGNCINSSRTQTSQSDFRAGNYSVNVTKVLPDNFPIYVVRYNTWQLCNSLSADNYRVGLNCEGSNSVNYLKEKDYFTQNLLNYPIWQFTTDGYDENNEGQRDTFVDSISTSTENIFLTYDGYTGSISVLSGENTVFCGTSGVGSVYFKDDIPTVKTTSPNVPYGRSINGYDILYFTQKLKDVPLQEFLLDGKRLEVFNKGLPIINNSSASLSARILFNTPTRLIFSNNGLKQNFPDSIYNGSVYPTFVAPVDVYGNILKFFPKLTVIGLNDTFSDNTVKICVLSASGDVINTFDSYSNINTFAPYSLSSYGNTNIDVDTLSSFAVVNLSADYVPNFAFSGITNTVTLSSEYYFSIYAPSLAYKTARTFVSNTAVLSAAAQLNWEGILSTPTVSRKFGSKILSYFPNNSVYDIQKINENFDYSQSLKNYGLMPFFDNQEALFDYFFGYVGGTDTSSPNELGKRIYEKTANFTININDVDRTNVNELYGLFKEIGFDSKKYNIDFPSNLQRLYDLLSINFNKLIGTDTGYNRNYNKNVNVDSQFVQTNLGNQLTETSLVSAGNPIVVYQHFQGIFYTITPSTIPLVGADINSFYTTVSSLSSHWDDTFGGLTVYPLCAYQNSWNWGLPADTNFNSIFEQHDFFYQTPTNVSSLNKIETLVDWDNNQTSLSALQHNSDLFNMLYVSGGLVEQYFENALRKGVGLL